ncbi:hypothetical protein SMU85_09585 [Streptococcus mutans ST6]|uniref:hypothetical protein n=1 Tax=Streptococcus mutans TaxID=1309 RepID=UPI0002B5B3FD|nr:hypothetical protein [Streptococcus mutans]EMC25986.1 hypothetical protein SMU85_09585 [Streptococcus mutans ST6]
MALTDENMQDLQAVTKESAGMKEGEIIEDAGDGTQDYEVVASMDGTTQGIAVAPIVNGKADYSHYSQAATNLNRTLRLCYSIRELTLGSFVK